MVSRRSSETEHHLDVLVLGLGSAALEAARTFAATDVRFTVIANAPLGAALGAEPEIPLATLLHAAHLGFDIRHAHPFGFLHSEEVKVDPIMVMRRVREVREKALAARLREYEDLLPRVVEGTVVFESPDRVTVGTNTYTFSSLVIDDPAPRIHPKGWEPLRAHVHTLEEFFDLAAIPKTAVIVGAGPRALELAQSLARLGSAVTCLVPSGEPFAGLGDGPAAQAARRAFSKEFTMVDVALGHLEAALVEGTKVRLHGRGFEVVATCLVLATEEREAPRPLEGLPSGEEVGGRAVFHLRDHTPGGHWVGTGDPSLQESAYLAKERGRNAAHAVLAALGKGTPGSLGAEGTPAAPLVPFVLARTSPSLARVGLGESDAMAAGARVHTFTPLESGLTLLSGKEGGLVRLFSDPSTHRLLGAEIVHERGEHLAHSVALALRAGLSVDALASPCWEPAWEGDLTKVVRSGRL